ncbi:hypothetical protein ACW9HQ_53585 [Nocardia gipuzkoensis]
MPSAVHEALIELFRLRPELVAELLTSVVGMRLPEFDQARLDSADFPDIDPTEYRAEGGPAFPGGTDAQHCTARTDERVLSGYYREGFVEGEVKGEVKGEVEALMTVFAARGLQLSDELQAKVRACADPKELEVWIRRAVTAESVDEVFAE